MPETYVEAEYTDGYVHREDDADVSAYEPGRNVFYDIVHGRPEPEHGPMVRLSLVTPAHTYTVAWAETPAGAVPVREKHMQRDFDLGGEPLGPAWIVGIDFGYEWIDEDGEVCREIVEL